ncbi:MAG: hypothetical protein OXH52_06070 [Gammaproteobacteria bacterium]|nr:hypothetical protein [Gammaproteobacteria bacterium]
MRPDETIICRGDVAHPDAWRNRRVVLEVRNCPGKRLLVLGNHDTIPTPGGLRDAGFDTMWPSALYAGDRLRRDCGDASAGKRPADARIARRVAQGETAVVCDPVRRSLGSAANDERG